MAEDINGTARHYAQQEEMVAGNLELNKGDLERREQEEKSIADAQQVIAKVINQTNDPADRQKLSDAMSLLEDYKDDNYGWVPVNPDSISSSLELNEQDSLLRERKAELEQQRELNTLRSEKHFRDNEEAYKQQAVNDARRKGVDVNYPLYTEELPKDLDRLNIRLDVLKEQRADLSDRIRLSEEIASNSDDTAYLEQEFENLSAEIAFIEGRLAGLRGEKAEPTELSKLQGRILTVKRELEHPRNIDHESALEAELEDLEAELADMRAFGSPKKA